MTLDFRDTALFFSGLPCPWAKKNANFRDTALFFSHRRRDRHRLTLSRALYERPDFRDTALFFRLLSRWLPLLLPLRTTPSADTKLPPGPLEALLQAFRFLYLTLVCSWLQCPCSGSKMQEALSGECLLGVSLTS